MRIRFYAHLIFPTESGISNMLRAVDIVCQTAQTVAKVFNGKVIYVGDGSESFQYDDVVEFQNLPEEHKTAILAAFPFAHEISS